jgi:DNA-binding response OmpR family regulator
VSEARHGQADGGRRVLCVEEEAERRGRLCGWLRAAGHMVTVAADASAGLHLARGGGYDLYVLGGAEGRELERRIGRFDPRTPVLFYAHPADQAEGEGRLRAAHAFVTRAAGEAQFLAVVRLLIAAAPRPEA